jgi:saccharopine dehydrogenase-like NADP-dependent oxidoreductase
MPRHAFALLPRVVNAYAALAQQEYFDRIDSIDILDVLKTGCA